MNLQDTARRLFFIVGCGRSGTTLLKSMLDRHPRVAVPPETFFFSTIRRRFPGGDDAPLEEKARYIAARWWMRDAGVRAEALLERLRGEDQAGWPEFFLAVMAELGPEDGEADALGEKTPAHVVDAPTLLETFPEARVVQMLRDPRAVLHSYRQVKIGTNQAVGVAREWKAACAVHRRLAEHPRAVLLRYEDLVVDPEANLQRACACLGLDFLPELLEFHRRESEGFAAEQVHHRATLQPLFRDSLDSWRDGLPQGQLRLLEHLVREDMEHFGYAPETAAGAPGRARLLVSEASDRMHRHFVRRPRQVMKRLRAQRRMSRGGGPQ
jgi:hypothetical protein